MKLRFIATILLIGLLFPISLWAKKEQPAKKVEWHTYAQLRFATNFADNYNFSVRRLKFWIKSSPGFSEHWSFKVQAIFMSIQNEKFFLQDIFAQYRWGQSSIRFGQFIPQYSLQRFQPDYLIPSIERARAVSILIPDGTSGVRDIGIQYNLRTANNNLQFNIGVFNGYGIKNYRFTNAGIMVTQNLSYRISLEKGSLKLGLSTMFRKGENLYLPGILSDTVSYTGNEFRFNIYGIFTSKVIDIQAEFLQSNLKIVHANGYYSLATIKINNKNHAYLLYDHYTNDLDSALNNPYYVLGYNYLFKDYKIMLTMETGFQQSNDGWNNRTTLQFQIFFH